MDADLFLLYLLLLEQFHPEIAERLYTKCLNNTSCDCDVCILVETEE